MIEKKRPGLFDMDYCAWAEEKDTWGDHPRLDDNGNGIGCIECLEKNHGIVRNYGDQTIALNDWQSLVNEQSLVNVASIKGK